MTANPSTLERRLRALGYDGPLLTSDDYRSAILSLLCAEAVCDRFETPKGKKLLKFRDAWELVFGAPFETRERAAKRKERAA